MNSWPCYFEYEARKLALRCNRSSFHALSIQTIELGFTPLRGNDSCTCGGDVFPYACSCCQKGRNMDLHIILISIAAAWTVDDWCPTPPRPPWPWPWLLRKLIAVIGGVAFVWVMHLAGGGGGVDIVPVAIVAGLGGAFVASLITGLVGGLNRNVAAPRA